MGQYHLNSLEAIKKLEDKLIGENTNVISPEMLKLWAEAMSYIGYTHWTISRNLHVTHFNAVSSNSSRSRKRDSRGRFVREDSE